MSRILLADDHPMIRTALEALLSDTPFQIVGMAATGREAIAEIERLGPDMLLLDLQMPDGDGMDVLRTVRAGGSTLSVVLLTAAIDDSALLEAKSLKVDGIVLKNSDPAFLLDCLDRVRHGRSWFDPELADRARQLSRSSAREDRATLSPRERQLVGLVRQGLRNREIAEQLKVTEGTVKAYLHALFDKVGVASRTELALRADEYLAQGLKQG
jgi:two-component system nitrate/nitrite response regulator NarP